MSEENVNVNVPVPPQNRSSTAANTHSVHIVYNQEDRSSSTDSFRSEDYFSRQWSILASMTRTQQTLADCLALLMRDEREDE